MIMCSVDTLTNLANDRFLNEEEVATLGFIGQLIRDCAISF